MRKLSHLGRLAALAIVGAAFTVSACPQVAYAQTNGMERRDDRRDTRQTSRDVKHECNANTNGQRSDCRQAKHSTKQAGRQGDLPANNTAHPPPH